MSQRSPHPEVFAPEAQPQEQLKAAGEGIRPSGLPCWERRTPRFPRPCQSSEFGIYPQLIHISGEFSQPAHALQWRRSNDWTLRDCELLYTCGKVPFMCGKPVGNLDSKMTGLVNPPPVYNSTIASPGARGGNNHWRCGPDDDEATSGTSIQWRRDGGRNQPRSASMTASGFRSITVR